MRGGDHSVEAALPDQVEAIRGHPMTLVIAARDLVLWPDAEAIRRPQTSRKQLELRAVFADTNDAALVRTGYGRLPRAAFAIVEISCPVGLQIQRELVIVVRRDTVVVEALVPVGFAI